MSKEQQAAYKQRQSEIKTQKQYIEEVELNARFQKAQYETMYFTLENEKIKNSYFELRQKQIAEEATQSDPSVLQEASEEVANG